MTTATRICGQSVSNVGGVIDKDVVDFALLDLLLAQPDSNEVFFVEVERKLVVLRCAEPLR